MLSRRPGASEAFLSSSFLEGCQKLNTAILQHPSGEAHVGEKQMTTMNKLSEYFFTKETPWSFRLLVLLLFLLVGGGLYLDDRASKVSYPEIVDRMEEITDKETGNVTKISKRGYDAEERKLVMEISKEKSQRLHESATLLYDFAKIVLGALIASLTQLINASTKRTYGPNIPDPQQSTDEEATPQQG